MPNNHLESLTLIILEKPQKTNLFLNGLKLPALKLWGGNVLKMQGSCLVLDFFFFLENHRYFQNHS